MLCKFGPGRTCTARARIPNEVIAEQTLRDAAVEGINPPNGVYDGIPVVVSTGEPDGLDVEAYVRGHLILRAPS